MGDFLNWLVLSAFGIFMQVADYVSTLIPAIIKFVIAFGFTTSQAHLIVFGGLFVLVMIVLWRATTVIVKF